jgi:hypothetical protein
MCVVRSGAFDGHERMVRVDPFENAAIDVDRMRVSLSLQPFRNPFAAVPHRALDRCRCLSRNIRQPVHHKIFIAHPRGSLNMTHRKFSIRAGAEDLKVS